MIHFKLISVCRVRYRLLAFFFLPIDIQLFWHNLLKRLSFLYGIAFPQLLKTSSMHMSVC